MATAEDRLADIIDRAIDDWEDDVDMAKGKVPYRSAGDLIIERLGLQLEISTGGYSHRWTTEWKEGRA